MLQHAIIYLLRLALPKATQSFKLRDIFGNHNNQY